MLKMQDNKENIDKRILFNKDEALKRQRKKVIDLQAENNYLKRQLKYIREHIENILTAKTLYSSKNLRIRK